MDGSAAAILGLLEAFYCPFIPHSCRATPVVLAVVSSLDAGSATVDSGERAHGPVRHASLVSSFPSRHSLGSASYLQGCSLETAVRHHGSIKRAPKNTAGKLQPEPRRLKDLGHGPTRGRYDSRQYSQRTFRLSMSPSSTREEVYKTILTIPAVEWRSRR